MSEEKPLKERFGKLGLYLVEKAQNEIKDINQLNLFQKARIKKKIMETFQERSDKIKSDFAKEYEKFCNNSLSVTLLKSKDYLLHLKNRLIKELKEDLKKEIEKKITSDYLNYIDYLVRKIAKFNKNSKESSQISLSLNSRDYVYISKHKKELEGKAGFEFQIHKSMQDFIGGFKITVDQNLITFDNTLDNLIEKNQSIIEKEFTSVISEEGIQKVGNQFENFIQKMKNNVEDYFNRYEQA